MDVVNILDRVSWVGKISGKRHYGTVVAIAAGGVAYRVRHDRTGITLVIPRAEVTKECR